MDVKPPKKIPEETQLVRLQHQQEILRERLEAADATMEHYESEEWSIIATKLLPSIARELAMEAMEIDELDPQYERKKLIAQGKFNAIKELTGRLNYVKQGYSTVRSAVDENKRAIEAWYERNKPNGS